MNAKMYGLAQKSFALGEIDWVGGTVMCLLLDSTHTPSQDTHQYADDVSADEVTGGVYARVTVTGMSATYDTATNTLKLDCDDIVFEDYDVDADYAVIFVDTGADSVSPLICYIDFGGTVEGTGVDFTIEINAGGLLTSSTAG